MQLSGDLNEKYQQLCDSIYMACDEFSQTSEESPFRKNNAYFQYKRQTNSNSIEEKKNCIQTAQEIPI